MSPPSSEGGSGTPRERILDAASSVFAEVGFAGARVDDIAERAGVNKAMLYYHVGDKRELYTAVLLRNFDRVGAMLAEARSRDGSVADRIREIVASLVRAVDTYPDHPRIVLREVASGGASLPPEVLARMLELFGLVGGLLREGMASGELRATDPLLTHLTLVGAAVFLTSMRPLRGRAAELAAVPGLPDADTDIATFLSDLLLEGLAAPPVSGGSR